MRPHLASVVLAVCRVDFASAVPSFVSALSGISNATGEQCHSSEVSSVSSAAYVSSAVSGSNSAEMCGLRWTVTPSPTPNSSEQLGITPPPGILLRFSYEMSGSERKVWFWRRLWR